MSARTLLRDALKAALPKWQIVADPRVLDSVRKPGALVLWTNKVTRPDKVTLDLLVTELSLWVLTAATDPAAIADDLDTLFEAVAEALEPMEAFVWTEAEWGVLDEKWQGVRLTLTCTSLIET